MIVRIPYTKYSFEEPEAISEATYTQIKKQLSINPKFDFEPPHTPPSEKFKGWYKVFNFCWVAIISLLVFAVLSLAIDPDKNLRSNGVGFYVFQIITNIGGLAVFLFGYLFLSGKAQTYSSYADFVEHKKKYYKKMKKDISASNSYVEYYLLFYNKHKPIENNATLHS